MKTAVDDNTNNTGMNINDLNGVPPVSNDYNSVQPSPTVDINNMQTPGVNPVEEVDLNSIPGVTDVPPVEQSVTPPVVETPQPTEMSSMESITPDTIDMNTVSSTPLESNEVTPPPVASMDSTPQNLSEPLPSVAPTADVLPVQGSMDVVNTLEEQPEKGKGGSAVVIVLIVIIVALLATIGYFAIQIFL